MPKKKSKNLTAKRVRRAFSTYSEKDVRIIRSSLEAIERREGAIRTSRILELARDPSHPLNPYVFKLSDRQAAERWRLHAIRQMCQTVRVEFVDDAGNTKHSLPAFVSVRVTSQRENDEGAMESFVERAYRSAEKAMADPATRQELLDEALRQADMWQARYRALSELGPVFEALASARKHAKRGA